MGGWLCSCLKQETLIINGFYLKLLQRIGEGGFSYIQLAEDLKTKQHYAIKRLLAQETDQVTLIKDEIKCYKLFASPHIIPLLDYSIVRHKDVTEINLLLPYYKRGSLHDLISRRLQLNSPLQERMIYGLFRGICRALHVMHNYPSGPLTHRDVKPGNVLISDDGNTVLMDFGSVIQGQCKISSRKEAIAMQDIAAERSTLPYRAPELFEVPSDCVIDEKVDIWSLGCVLYEMVFLRSPFVWTSSEQGGSIALAVLGRHLKYPDVIPFSQGLVDFIEFMLQVDPARRPDIDTVIQKLDMLESNSGFTSDDNLYVENIKF